MTSTLRVLWRGAWLGVLGLVVLLLILLLAWVASNWVDEAPSPTPPPLELGPPKPGSKFFFEMQGMLAPPGQSAEQTGRQDWQRLTTAKSPDLSASAPEMAGRLKPIQALPLNCRAPDDCAKVLAGAPDKIAAQLQPLAELGRRCVAALDDLRFEESLPTPLTAATPLPAYQGVVQCGHWFKGQALLAASRGDQAEALANLRHGRRVADAVLDGSRVLIGKMIGAAVARSQFDAVAAVAVLQPAWAAELAPPPLPAGAKDAATWVTTESAFMRGTLDEARKDCRTWLPQMIFATDNGLSPLSLVACRFGIGFLPNATGRLLNQQWLQIWTSANKGLDAAVDEALAQHAQALAAPKSTGLAWRNTIGELVVDIAAPSLAPYLARQADVELHRQALALALTALAQKVPAAGRAAWLDAQGLAPRVRQRLSWADNGAVLAARPWAAELPGNDPRRADIRIPVALP